MVGGNFGVPEEEVENYAEGRDCSKMYAAVDGSVVKMERPPLFIIHWKWVLLQSTTPPIPSAPATRCVVKNKKTKTANIFLTRSMIS